MALFLAVAAAASDLHPGPAKGPAGPDLPVRWDGLVVGPSALQSAGVWGAVMHPRAPGILLLVRDIAADLALPAAACLSREPLSRGSDCAACPAGGTKDGVQRSHFIRRC